MTDESGNAVSGGSLQLDNATVVPNAQGSFTIDNVSPGKDKVLKYQKSGYIPGWKLISVFEGDQTSCNLTAKKIGVSQQINGAQNNTVTDIRSDGRNGKVSIQANSIVDSGGKAVASPIVEVTTLLPSDPNFTYIFPGAFLGGGTPGSTANPAPIESYGVINVDLKDSQGNRLYLAAGKTATVTFPIDPTNDPGTPSVPIWFLSESIGIWVEEGAASRVGNTYVATVSHFSPVNIDTWLRNRSWKNILVVDQYGKPVKSAHVTLEGTGYRFEGYTEDDGLIHFNTKGSDWIHVRAEKGNTKSSVISEWSASEGQWLENRITLPVGNASASYVEAGGVRYTLSGADCLLHGGTLSCSGVNYPDLPYVVVFFEFPETPTTIGQGTYKMKDGSFGIYPNWPSTQGSQVWIFGYPVATDTVNVTYYDGKRIVCDFSFKAYNVTNQNDTKTISGHFDGKIITP